MRDAFQFLGKILRKRKLRRRGLSIGLKRKTGEKPGLVSYFEVSRVARAATGVVFVALAALIVWSGGYYYWLTVGGRAMEDVYASIGFTFRDDEKTKFKRQEAIHGIPVVYKLDEQQVGMAMDKLIVLLKSVPGGKEGSSLTPDLFQRVSELFPSLRPTEVGRLIAAPNAADLLTRLKPIILKTCRYRIAPVEIPYRPEKTGIQVLSVKEVRLESQKSIEKEFPPPVGEETRWLLGAIAYHFTDDSAKQYRRKDADAVKALQAFARKSVQEQFTTVPEGRKIIERGQEITPTHVAQIEEMRRALSGRRSAGARLLSLVGAVVAVTAVVVASAVFLARFNTSVFASNWRLILVAILVLMSAGISKVLTYTRPASVFLAYFLAYPIAVPFGSFVLSMMLGLRLAVFVTVPMAILVGMAFGSSLSPVLVGILGGWAAAFFAGGVRHRKDFIKTVAAVGVVNGLIIAAIGALTNAEVNTLVAQAGGGVAMAIGSIVLAAVFLPAFEWAFKIPTSISLVELADSNHPLLKRLIMEAPGTYYHSLMVGNLAESAVEAVGGNPLVARVGAYFHDAGKLKKPLYFSENEAFGKSKHDTLNPSMSNLIILSHVKEGVDLACKHKLNKVLIDIIKEHHGTSLDYYFYRRAVEANGSDVAVDEKEFRYPGPRPQSRESAIIMLADSVEAASRSLEKPTTAKIRAAVRNTIRMKFEDGQLDECDLTLKDLHEIEETFNRILVNTLHQRVKYPEEGKEEKGEKRERPVQELAKNNKRAPG